jgi:hypothetical protein
MDIKEQIYLEYAVEFPITGGYGSTIETCIIIKQTNDYIPIQNAYLNCFRDEGQWRKVEQKLMIIDGGKIDEISI